MRLKRSMSFTRASESIDSDADDVPLDHADENNGGIVVSSL